MLELSLNHVNCLCSLLFPSHGKIFMIIKPPPSGIETTIYIMFQTIHPSLLHQSPIYFTPVIWYLVSIPLSPPCAAERLWQPCGLTSKMPSTQNILGSIWIHEDPIIHLIINMYSYLPSLLMFFVFFLSLKKLIYSTCHGSFRREAADQKGTA